MATIVKRPNGKWQAQVRTDGKNVSKTFTTRRGAVSWSRDIEAKAERGCLPVDMTLLRTTTFGEVLVRYRTEIVARKQAGRNEACMIASIERDDPQLFATRLDKLSDKRIARWRDRRLQTMKSASVCRYLGIMQHALDIAMRDWGVPLPTNPVREVRRPTIRNRRERRITPDERTALFDAAAAYRNPLMHPLVVLALETAMRRGELLAIRWADVDARLSVIRLRTSKNGHARTIPLSPTAIDTLTRLHTDFGSVQSGDRVFTLKGNAVQLAWGRIVARAGIIDLRFHDMRHEAISGFFERGFSLPEVALISGHRDTRMLLRYTHLNAVNIVAKLRQTSAAFGDSKCPPTQ
ncbi:site-specific integrase [Tropicimonas sp. TH_r6]|uniref:site-specific integrase n=1 Tax=Tropicimonas sp. TH_r6 TaxID=3082085 RepID=UPI002953722B|nr:site-specific integrase [Tropicimonas sp. TH_r6]MDV7145242.1 site-specific integrase [Tropicimonas sp. TH_r6]